MFNPTVDAGATHRSAPGPLLGLAPLALENLRSDRYVGDGLCVPLDRLVERDRALLRSLYAQLSELLVGLVDEQLDDAAKWSALEAWLGAHPAASLIDEARELGLASREADDGVLLAEAMHDARGGALGALLGRLQILEHLPRDTSELNTIFVLVRDHLKILRSAFLQLDDARRKLDQERKSHAAKLTVDKWHRSVVGPNWRERPVRMVVEAHYDGALSECCLESAALDRIFYNLANNASRHAATDRVDFVFFPLPAPSRCLRFVVSNEVSEDDAATLRFFEKRASPAADAGAASALPLPTLFGAAESSTGSGFGLTVVADFVAHAFGLADGAEAVRKQYVGAVLHDETFRVWFHWPIANDELPPKLDDVHDPTRSVTG